MNKILSKLDRMDIMKMFHFFMVIFMFSSWMISASFFKLPIITVAFLNLVFYHKKFEKWSVSFYSLGFIYFWLTSYYTVANHLTLLGIFTLYVTYRLWFEDREWNFPAYLLSLVILVATLHKLLSPYFMNGNLIGELFLSGTSFPFLQPIVDVNFEENTAAFIELYKNAKYNHSSSSIAVTDASVLLSKIITWIIVVGEILLSVALFAFKPIQKYYSLFIFLIGTALFRSEFAFFCILILISCFDHRIQNKKVQQLLKILFLIFACAYVKFTFNYL